MSFWQSLTSVDPGPIWLSLKLSALTTLLLLLLVTPIAWWLAHANRHTKSVVTAIATLPLVLPPSVLGFYLLLLLGAQGPLAPALQALGITSLAFTFPGLVVASVIYSFPFALQPIQNAFEAIGKRPMEVAATLGASPLDRFFSVALPLARPGLLTAAVLSFAHTIGEFGVVLMIGGNIPGETKVLSVAIYDHVEAIEYSQAHLLSALMVGFSLLVLFFLYWLNHQSHPMIGHTNQHD
ncbi:molybdate ABC transporter permease subunit [Halioxenophilus sp. WMMB6]|uniref:molybdate ABC transporter permease subunit n=1 Tax=Halioxenophilus sp. WMMB6 TaxID=3073815 RepID=UPI00295E9ABC|nr:molybdate ABC transporter permease subunit [Halioxenophilus sp. WMMB6]